MANQMKKLISMLLVVSMLFSMLSVSVFAAEENSADLSLGEVTASQEEEKAPAEDGEKEGPSPAQDVQTPELPSAGEEGEKEEGDGDSADLPADSDRKEELGQEEDLPGAPAQGGGSGTGTGTGTNTGTNTPATPGGSILPPVEDLDDEDVPLANLPFLYRDVLESDWYYGAVRYMVDNGLMEGMTADTFAPDLEISRAMIVTVLFRLAGSPKTEIVAVTDVDADQWYAEAVSWAIGSKILNGYEDGRFLPDGKITREELVTVLYRFADLLGYAPSAEGDLTAFEDAETVSSWAVESMKWAVGANLILGRNGNRLAPAATTTRGEAVTLFARFDQSYTKVGKETAALPQTKPEDKVETESNSDDNSED